MTVQATPMFLQNATGHPAEDVRRMTHMMMNVRPGIVQSGDLAVTQNGTPNMSVNVASGNAFVAGTEATYQGLYHCENRGVLNVVVPASDPTNPRIDLIVLKVQDAIYSGATNAASIVDVPGTPAGTPVEPSPPNNCLVLAKISVAANATTVVTANITDYRTSYNNTLNANSIANVGMQARAAGLGGVIVCSSTTRPTINLSVGMRIFETDTKLEYNYNGTSWEIIGGVATAWTAPTLLNSWVNFGGTQQVAQYRKIGDIVYLRGLIRFGTINLPAFTLPAGFRPPADLVFPSQDNNTMGRVDVISINGNVTPVAIDNVLQTLNGINFSIT